MLKVVVFKFFRLKWIFGTSLTNTIHIKQECKEKGLEDSNAIGNMDIFVVVPIGGAIVHPR